MKLKSILYRLELPCQEEDLCDPLGIITLFNIPFCKLCSTIKVKSKKLEIFSGTVCLGPISPLHLAFQVSSYSSSKPVFHAVEVFVVALDDVSSH